MISRTSGSLCSIVLCIQIATGGQAKQPKAANMMKLKWNDKLAVVAQRLADQCVFAHDKNDARLIPDFKSVGQNLYIAYSSKKKDGVPVEKSVMAWYNEVLKFKASSIEPFKFSEPTGHYTQLAWATTTDVGCGSAQYKAGKWYKRLVVCNYGEMGNHIGGAMYKQGDPCSKCPSGTSCTSEGGLCA